MEKLEISQQQPLINVWLVGVHGSSVSHFGLDLGVRHARARLGWADAGEKVGGKMVKKSPSRAFLLVPSTPPEVSRSAQRERGKARERSSSRRVPVHTSISPRIPLRYRPPPLPRSLAAADPSRRRRRARASRYVLLFLPPSSQLLLYLFCSGAPPPFPRALWSSLRAYVRASVRGCCFGLVWRAEDRRLVLFLK
jgi:hypothetical protein